MRTPTITLALGIALPLVIPATTLAEGFYLTTHLGISEQVNNSEPYGNNIAADADFPAEFDAGDGNVFGIGVGYRFNDSFRVEGRFSQRDSSFNDRKIGTGARTGEEYILDGEVESNSLTVEAFYDFVNNTPFTPYVKAGIGVSDNSYSARIGGAGVAAFDPFDGIPDGFYDNYSDGDSSELSWNVGFGGSYALSEKVSLFAEYQYSSFGDVETGQDSFTDGFRIDDITTNEIMAGIRLNF